MKRGFDEGRAVRLLERVLGRGVSSDAVELGIGDDAALLRLGRVRLVWTIDSSREGVHFERRFATLPDIGFRSFQAAASDLAAMGARPVAALCDVTLAAGSAERDLASVAAGQAQAARALGCPIVGGNLAAGDSLSIVTTVLGRVERPLLRSGAREGDELWLVGELGLARAGLLLLQQAAVSAGRRARSSRARCLEAWRRPRARIEQGMKLVGRARSAIDVSDGLGEDARRLSAASGVRLVVEEPALARALGKELVSVALELGRDPLELAIEGGEDYALLATGARSRRPRFARRIGRVERGRGAVLERGAGGAQPLGRGHDHFARRRA